MSYDVSLHGPKDCNCDCCRVRRADFDANYTSNCGAMFIKAGLPIRELDGMLAADALPRLNAAIAAMTADKPGYEKLNPANGWGDYEGALAFFREIRNGCEAAPMGRLRVHA